MQISRYQIVNQGLYGESLNLINSLTDKLLVWFIRDLTSFSAPLIRIGYRWTWVLYSTTSVIELSGSLTWKTLTIVVYPQNTEHQARKQQVPLFNIFGMAQPEGKLPTFCTPFNPCSHSDRWGPAIKTGSTCTNSLFTAKTFQLIITHVQTY